MATAPRVAIRPLKSMTGMPIAEEGFPEKATQTFKAGALVFLDGTGFLTECADSDPALIMGVASRDGQNGTNNGDKTQVVYLAHPSTLFVGNMDTSASEGNGTGANTDRGKMYGVKRSSVTGNPWYVDKTEVTAKRVIVWGFWDQVIDGVAPVVTDTIPLVVFSFDPQYFQGNRTS